MSVPARQLAPDRKRPTAVPAPKRAPAPKTTREPAPRAVAAPKARRRARRGHRTAFWLFAATVASVMVVGLVAVNALSVQTTYHMHQYQQEVTDLASQQIQLTDEVAALSAPGRVAAWARLNGMQVPQPGDTIVLRVPGVLARSTSLPANP
jgi:cell division protein FtsL